MREFSAAEVPARRSVSAARGTHFGALGIGEGLAEYEVRISPCKALFIEHPCDMLRVTADGVRGETLYADGRDVLLPAVKDGKYLVEIEKWGHCNFDDSQSPALRTSCKKGALSFGSAEEEIVQRCDFRLLEAFGEETVSLAGGMPVRIGINKWNSTRKPVFCSYTTVAERKAERLILKTTEKVDVAVYLDGKKVGMCDFGTFELTGFVNKGERRALTVVYRKQVWTQDCGTLRLLHVDGVRPAGVRVRTADEFCAPVIVKGAAELPVCVASEGALCADLHFAREGYLKFYGKNVKVTCVVGGRVVGRLLVGWTNAPSLQGGDPDLFYFCPAWNGRVWFHLESLGEGACLERVEMLI